MLNQKYFTVAFYCSVLFSSSLLLIGCTASPHSAEHYAANLYATELASCYNQLSTFNQEVQRQQINDAQSITLPQYPHLAFDRFSQAQLLSVKTQQDRQQWLKYVAQLSQRQRHAEYSNMVSNQRFDLPTLDYCANRLTQIPMTDDDHWQQLTEHAPSIPSSYEPWLRFFGLYPITKVVAGPSIISEAKRIKAGFSQPVDGYQISYQLSVDNTPTITQHEISQWFSEALNHSTLQWPQFSQQQLDQLYRHYAPVITVESASLDDKPGTVEYNWSDTPSVNATQPAIYLDHSYTRFHGQTLLQLNYSLWFANRTPTASLDPYAGPFDGVLLRLTLDQHGNPLFMDSIHHCGCYHMIFNFSDKLQSIPLDPNTEAPLILTRLRHATNDALQVTLSHGEHMIKHVSWGPTPHLVRAIPGIPYDQLRSLPTRHGVNKSLFDEHGMLPASERLESTYLWPFGIPSPGTMRQVGHHATAFIGERHFDEPHLFEQFFVPRID
ncbi:hypothetical protein [Photobacterium nomapromontoriensis]|uniref:hypothetical protein n=1 Tax=Photobacterium nomapromontoriensis TaxID=2910237 RepID=UPI003D0BD154